MLMRIRRRNKVIKALTDKNKDRGNGRFIIKCLAKNKYQVFDKNKGLYVEDFLWGGWDSHAVMWYPDGLNTQFAKSYNQAKQTCDVIFTLEAKERFSRIVDSYHRKNSGTMLYL